MTLKGTAFQLLSISKAILLCVCVSQVRKELIQINANQYWKQTNLCIKSERAVRAQQSNITWGMEGTPQIRTKRLLVATKIVYELWCWPKGAPLGSIFLRSFQLQFVVTNGQNVWPMSANFCIQLYLLSRLWSWHWWGGGQWVWEDFQACPMLMSFWGKPQTHWRDSFSADPLCFTTVLVTRLLINDTRWINGFFFFVGRRRATTV